MNEADPIDALAMRIARELKESQVSLTHRVVSVLGEDLALALFTRTVETEAQGGMMLPDGSRRRTPGGVFFFLARQECTPEQKAQVFPRTYQAKKREKTAPSFSWDERIAIIESITAKGKITTVKITLIGRFAKYVDKGACVIGVMQHTGEKLPTLPQGVPTPASIKTNYVVYVAKKQWVKVAPTLHDQEDALIIEGFPQLDVKTGAISVFVSAITSKKQQQAKREAQKAGAVRE